MIDPSRYLAMVSTRGRTSEKDARTQHPHRM